MSDVRPKQGANQENAGMFRQLGKAAGITLGLVGIGVYETIKGAWNGFNWCLTQIHKVAILDRALKGIDRGIDSCRGGLVKLERKAPWTKKTVIPMLGLIPYGCIFALDWWAKGAFDCGLFQGVSQLFHGEFLSFGLIATKWCTITAMLTPPYGKSWVAFRPFIRKNTRLAAAEDKYNNLMNWLWTNSYAEMAKKNVAIAWDHAGRVSHAIYEYCGSFVNNKYVVMVYEQSAAMLQGAGKIMGSIHGKISPNIQAVREWTVASARNIAGLVPTRIRKIFSFSRTAPPQIKKSMRSRSTFLPIKQRLMLNAKMTLKRIAMPRAQNELRVLGKSVAVDGGRPYGPNGVLQPISGHRRSPVRPANKLAKLGAKAL